MAKDHQVSEREVPGPDDETNQNLGGNILAKLSIATMRCDPEKAKREMRKVLLCRMIGRADAIKWKKAANDELVPALVGAFAGINAETGEAFESGVAYLPPGIHDLVANPLVENAKEGENADRISVEFAYEIYSFPAANPRGYSYEAKNLAPTVRKDPLAGYRNLLALAKPSAQQISHVKGT